MAGVGNYNLAINQRLELKHHKFIRIVVLDWSVRRHCLHYIAIKLSSLTIAVTCVFISNCIVQTAPENVTWIMTCDVFVKRFSFQFIRELQKIGNLKGEKRAKLFVPF